MSNILVPIQFNLFVVIPGLRERRWKVAAVREGNSLTLRRLMSYIYMEHPFLMFLDHTQRPSTVGRTPLDE